MHTTAPVQNHLRLYSRHQSVLHSGGRTEHSEVTVLDDRVSSSLPVSAGRERVERERERVKEGRQGKGGFASNGHKSRRLGVNVACF